MSDTPIIKVENLGKLYRIQHQQAGGVRYKALRDVMADKFKALIANRKSEIANRKSEEDFWALKDISFEVKRGEVVGIIGRNGAGKSTLLKILSRITEPTEGRVCLKGRVASLLEVGTGFHPELTGRENIFLNGAILGMSKAEIKGKFDEIVAFAEIEKFLDTPVKRYSSGMYVRLAFAVAAHLEPEILIVDEVLAVGDAEFQKKCLGKMKDVASGGRTVLFVSHNMGVITNLTNTCFLLRSGRLDSIGPSREIVEGYLKASLEPQTGKPKLLECYRRDKTSDSPVQVTKISLNGCSCDEIAFPQVALGSSFTISIQLDVTRPVQGALLMIKIKTSQGHTVAVLLSWDQNCMLFLEPGRHRVTAALNDLAIAPGEYFVDVGINQSIETRSFDVILDFPLFAVRNTGQVTHWLQRPWGILHCKHVEWNVTHEATQALFKSGKSFSHQASNVP